MRSSVVMSQVWAASATYLPTEAALEGRTIEGDRHSGNTPEAFNRGLRFLFQQR
jgi:hypothetical protein